MLEANLAAQEANVELRDQTQLVDLDIEFHKLLCDFLENVEIRRVKSQLRDRVRRVIYLINKQNPGRFKSLYEEHRDIARAILDGNAELAVSQLIHHFEYGKRRILSPRGS